MHDLIVLAAVCYVMNINAQSVLNKGRMLPPNTPPNVIRNMEYYSFNSAEPMIVSFPGAPQIMDGIIRQTSQTYPDESYEYSYETAGGIKVEERGDRSNLKDAPIISSGSFLYRAPDNSSIALKYIANENGFQPEGSHLPTPPPVPPQIVRALEWNAAHPE